MFKFAEYTLYAVATTVIIMAMIYWLCDTQSREERIERNIQIMRCERKWDANYCRSLKHD